MSPPKTTVHLWALKRGLVRTTDEIHGRARTSGKDANARDGVAACGEE